LLFIGSGDYNAFLAHVRKPSVVISLEDFRVASPARRVAKLLKSRIVTYTSGAVTPTGRLFICGHAVELKPGAEGTGHINHFLSRVKK